jgi:hypothetical protein
MDYTKYLEDTMNLVSEGIKKSCAKKEVELVDIPTDKEIELLSDVKGNFEMDNGQGNEDNFDDLEEEKDEELNK